ncbi:MAG: heme NO-binding domain-containing protein [Longimicrobiales bacterium]
MIGIVNQAFAAFVTEQLGDAVWAEATARASVEDVVLLTTEAYPDELTFQLAGHVCDIASIPLDDALTLFGEYWISYAHDRGYGPLIDDAGGDLQNALHGLEALHTRVALVFPDADVPDFTAEGDLSSGMQLLYRSRRRGLGPFVLGTLKGLVKHFDEPVTIVRELLPSEGDGASERFSLTRDQS